MIKKAKLSSRKCPQQGANERNKAHLRAGDSFQVVAPQGALHNSTWFKGKTFVVRRVVRQRIKGYDDVLDLGWLVTFIGTIDPEGNPVTHALPAEWCQKLVKVTRSPR